MGYIIIYTLNKSMGRTYDIRTRMDTNGIRTRKALCTDFLFTEDWYIDNWIW